MKKFHKIDKTTTYFIDTVTGQGTAYTVTTNLNWASDQIAKHVGLPLDHGDWQRATKAEAKTAGVDPRLKPEKLVFEVQDVEAFRASEARKKRPTAKDLEGKGGPS